MAKGSRASRGSGPRTAAHAWLSAANAPCQETGGKKQICLPKHGKQWYVVAYTAKNGAEMWGVGEKESGVGLCG